MDRLCLTIQKCVLITCGKDFVMEFKKYTEIENSFNKEYMERVKREVPADMQYVVQEKVHGANTSFLYDGELLEFAKRTAVLTDGENFYDQTELILRYESRVKSLWSDVKLSHPTIVQMQVYGEMFGGVYPHPDVKVEKKLTVIQKGVFYTPKHEFYGFDIAIITDEGRLYLPVDETNMLFEKNDIFYARSLFKGTLAECVEYPNEFQSCISEWLGLPQIDDNICEGVVIRPVVPIYLSNGCRVLIKNKNARFAEKKRIRKRNALLAHETTYSEELVYLLDEATAFVTKNRLDNVLSKTGPVNMTKEFGHIMGSLSKDSLTDFMKEFGSRYGALDKSEQKVLNREVGKRCAELLKKQIYY